MGKLTENSHLKRNCLLGDSFFFLVMPPSVGVQEHLPALDAGLDFIALQQVKERKMGPSAMSIIWSRA